MNSYDLAIAYRIYPKVAKPATGLPFNDDKLRMSEICLRSFKRSLGDLRVKLWVLLDGCPGEYTALFQKYFSAEDLVLLRLPGVGNRATFGKQIEILLEQAESDLVYFAEDDYFYLPNQFHRMLEFLHAHEDVHFVTPYDHPDCYTLEIHRHPKWVRAYGGHHWRTAASTCLTFLTRRRTLRRKQAFFKSYCWRNYDCSLWLSLTKHSLFSPLQFLRFTRRQPWFAKIIAKAWLYGWPQILFGETMKLWVPVPGLATHLDSRALSPTIDWSALMEEVADHIESENARRVDYIEPPASSAPKG
jgi:hypothetical protein